MNNGKQILTPINSPETSHEVLCKLNKHLLESQDNLGASTETLVLLHNLFEAILSSQGNQNKNIASINKPVLIESELHTLILKKVLSSQINSVDQRLFIKVVGAMITKPVLFKDKTICITDGEFLHCIRLFFKIYLYNSCALERSVKLAKSKENKLVELKKKSKSAVEKLISYAYERSLEEEEKDEVQSTGEIGDTAEVSSPKSSRQGSWKKKIKLTLKSFIKLATKENEMNSLEIRESACLALEFISFLLSTLAVDFRNSTTEVGHFESIVLSITKCLQFILSHPVRNLEDPRTIPLKTPIIQAALGLLLQVTKLVAYKNSLSCEEKETMFTRVGLGTVFESFLKYLRSGEARTNAIKSIALEFMLALVHSENETPLIIYLFLYLDCSYGRLLFFSEILSSCIKFINAELSLKSEEIHLENFQFVVEFFKKIMFLINTCDEEVLKVNGFSSWSDKKLHQKMLKDGAAKFYQTFNLEFSINGNKAMKKLRENEYFSKENEIDEVADFLFNNCKEGLILNPTQLGEFFGTEKDFNLQVLEKFITRFDFASERNLVESLRKFLSYFLLPGEGQKIDRIIQAFSNNASLQELFLSRLKYHGEEVDVLTTEKVGDCTFVLCYAIIMLNTDLHNKNIKPERKMTKQSFRSMNRGILDGRDVPSPILDEAFEEISSNEIILTSEKLHHSPQDRKGSGEPHLPSSFGKKQVTKPLLSESLFRVFWSPCCGLYSLLFLAYKQTGEILFEESKQLVHIVMDLVIFAAKNGRNTELAEKSLSVTLRSFISSFKLQYLEKYLFEPFGAKVRIHDLKANMIHNASLYALKYFVEHLKIVKNEHNICYGTDWTDILKFLSLIVRINYFVSDDAEVIQFQSTTLELTSVTTYSNFSNTNTISSARLAKILHQSANLVRSRVNVNDVEIFFSYVSEFSAQNFTHIIKGLIKNAELELSGTEVRVYSLQKIVELCDHCLANKEFAWKDLFHDFSTFFEVACMHPDENIGFYSTDAFKQIVQRYFENENQFLDFYPTLVEGFLRQFEVIQPDFINRRLVVLGCAVNILRGNLQRAKKTGFSMFNVLTKFLPQLSSDQDFDQQRLLLWDLCIELVEEESGFVAATGKLLALLVNSLAEDKLDLLAAILSRCERVCKLSIAVAVIEVLEIVERNVVETYFELITLTRKAPDQEGSLKNILGSVFRCIEIFQSKQHGKIILECIYESLKYSIRGENLSFQELHTDAVTLEAAVYLYDLVTPEDRDGVEVPQRMVLLSNELFYIIESLLGAFERWHQLPTLHDYAEKTLDSILTFFLLSALLRTPALRNEEATFTWAIKTISEHLLGLSWSSASSYKNIFLQYVLDILSLTSPSVLARLKTTRDTMKVLRTDMQSNEAFLYQDFFSEELLFKLAKTQIFLLDILKTQLLPLGKGTIDRGVTVHVATVCTSLLDFVEEFNRNKSLRSNLQLQGFLVVQGQSPNLMRAEKLLLNILLRLNYVVESYPLEEKLFKLIFDNFAEVSSWYKEEVVLALGLIRETLEAGEHASVPWVYPLMLSLVETDDSDVRKSVKMVLTELSVR
eukprot:snap_masked-scaffold_1-processed-gene-7.12-mRNA-1 protein AED:1.00 eAED:1.00 QI:0/-1/0/0/-1/1/1/0/1558